VKVLVQQRPRRLINIAAQVFNDLIHEDSCAV
jgi:hypothetical protein